MSENETNKNQHSIASDTGQTEQIPDPEKQEIITSSTTDQTTDQTTIEEENQQNIEIPSETIEQSEDKSELIKKTVTEDTSELIQQKYSQTHEKIIVKEEITGPVPTEFSANAKDMPKISIGSDGIMIIHDGNTSVLTSQLIRENQHNNEDIQT
jgi:hypothetical protein